MKTQLLLILVLLSFAVHASSQDCSSASMTLQSTSSSVPCNNTSPQGVVFATTLTETFKDVCTNTNNGNVYLSVLSTNTGSGQCSYSNTNSPCGGSGQPACNNVVISCPASFLPEVTHATGPTDYNRFYNRAYGQTLNGSGPVYVCGGQGSGPFTQDFQQCAGKACNPKPCTCRDCGCGSPIIIDVAGEGFKMTSMQDGVQFDIYGVGSPVQIAWTAKGSRNAFLVLDRNQNRNIDSGKELFGNFTAQDKCPHPNGFNALSEFDEAANGGNGDGVIDEHDAVWSHLLLWTDENHDGVAQYQELHGLPELGVYSLSLKYTEARYTDAFGNEFRYKARVNPNGQPPIDRVGRWAYDVFLIDGTK